MTAGQPPDLVVTGSGAAATEGGVAAGAGGAAAGERGIALVVAGRVGTVNLSTGEPADPTAALRSPYAPLPAEIGSQPNLLLRARYSVVPFRGRDDHLAALETWATDERIGRLALITGPGGSGKTRLAAELAERRRIAGWTIGFLQPRPPPLGLAGIVKAANPVLVVVDDAESRVPEVLDLLELLAGHRTDRAWRVVLLSRTAGDWWERLPAELLDSPAEPVVGAAIRHELEAAEPAPEDRRAAFAAAAGRFAEVLGRSGERIRTPDLADPRFGRPLFLQLAALSAVLGAGASGAADPAALVADAHVREHAYWRTSASGAALDLHDSELDRAVAVACLADVRDEDEASEVLRAVPELSGDAEGRRRHQVSQWLHGLYPADASAGWLPAVDPDLLAEAHVAAVLADTATLAERVFGVAEPDRSHKALSVLGRAARDYPAAAAALEAVLAARFADLVVPAMEVAQQVGDPLGPMLAIALERDPRPELVDATLAALPAETVSLLELGVVIAAADMERAKGEGDPATIAVSADMLAKAFVGVGRREEALASCQESVNLLRELVAAKPNQLEPNLALALGDLSNMIADVSGPSDEALSAAEESLALYQDLASERHYELEADLAADLARAILVRSSRLGDVGRLAEALEAATEAVPIYRTLDAASPAEYRPALAAALNDLATRLGRLGRTDEALATIEEAVAIYRDLADSRPDAFRPQLAAALGNLSLSLSDLGRLDDAVAPMEESVEICRELAAARPTVFREQLAAALGNLSAALARVERTDDAVSASNESVAVTRDLAAERPAASRSALALALNNGSNRLAELGRHDEALAMIEEAVALDRELAEQHPDAVGGELARSLNNLSDRLSSTGRLSEALAAIQESVSLRRSLAATWPGTYDEDLGTALNDLSGVLISLGHKEEALAAIEESIGILRERARERPAAWEANFAGALVNYSLRLADVGRTEDALRAIQDSIEILRRLADGRPAMRPYLATALETMATLLSGLGRMDEASAAEAESRSIGLEA